MMKRGKMRFFISAWLLLVALLWLSGEAVAGEGKLVTLDQKELLQVKVYKLIVDPTSQQPVVFLTEPSEEQALLIWIGPFEANAILSEIEGLNNQRPLTHDLLGRIIRKIHGNINRIVITHLKESVYYAKIEMERENSLIEIDARPSDSIVMALKFKAPIFVSRKLFEDMAVPLEKTRDIEQRYGFTMQDLTPSLIQSFSFETTEGVLISSVHRGSQAEKDGVERGDIFVEIEGKSIAGISDMKNALAKNKIAVQAKIFRRAHFISITLHLN